MTRPSNPEMPAAILAAAEKVVAEGGHEALNMRDLAGSVGVTPATLYYYFKSREHILLELRLRAARLLSERFAEIEVSRGAERAIRALGEAYINFAEEHPHLYTLLVEIRLGPDVVSESDLRRLRSPYDQARALLKGLVERGECRFDADERAVIGWVMLHGFSSLLVAGTLEGIAGNDRESLKRAFLDYYSTGPAIGGDSD